MTNQPERARCGTCKDTRRVPRFDLYQTEYFIRCPDCKPTCEPTGRIENPDKPGHTMPCTGCSYCKPAPNAERVDVDPIDFTCTETAMMRLHVEGNRIVRDIEGGDYFVAQGRVRQWLKSIEPYIQRIMERNNDRRTVT